MWWLSTLTACNGVAASCCKGAIFNTLIINMRSGTLCEGRHKANLVGCAEEYCSPVIDPFTGKQPKNELHGYILYLYLIGK
jgi:hypothetical protein